MTLSERARPLYVLAFTLLMYLVVYGLLRATPSNIHLHRRVVQ